MRSLLRWAIWIGLGFCLGLLLSLPFSPAHAQDPTPQMAQALNTQGQVAFSQGQVEAALALWQQSTELYQAIGDQTGVSGSLINQSRALETLGYYRRACQTLLTAIDLDQQLNEQWCEVHRRLGETNNLDPDTLFQILQQQPDKTLQILALRSLGNVLRLSGQLPLAQQLLLQSLALASEQGDSQQQLLSLLGLGQVEQSLCQQAIYRYGQTDSTEQAAALQTLVKQASDHYLEAEHLAQSRLQDSDHFQGGALLLSQALIRHLALLVAIESQPAIANLFPDLSHQLQTQLVNISRLPDLPPSRAAIYTHIDLANSYIARLSSSSAPPQIEIAAQLAQAHQQATDLDDREAQSYALGTLGHLYEQIAQQSHRAADWQQAQQVTASALTLAQTAQADHIAYQWQWQLGRIYTEQKETKQAIATYQAAAQTLQTLRQDLVAIESEAQFSFRDNVEPLYREWVELLVQTSNASSPPQQNLSQAIQAIDTLQLTALENFLSCNLTQTFQLGELQTENTLNHTTAILYPILLPNEIAVIVRLPQTADLQFHYIAISEAEVTQALGELRQQAENPYLSDRFLERSQQVYDWLIRPIEPLLKQQAVQTLVFVSDGALRNVPMGILHDGQHFLLEDYAVALSPGLQLPQSRALSQIDLAAIAFGLSEIRPDFTPHAGFGPLPDVEIELATISTQLPSRQYLNQSFTAQALQSLGDRNSAPIVHLATHGQFSSNPNDTYLLAWDRRITLDDFGQIFQGRTASADQEIELLILSACKTASGDTRATLGLAGVAIQSGARSTIASLWSVDDQSTAQLMTRLYQKLGQSPALLSRSEILRQAQLELLHTPGYQAPFYWAPYVLIGNWT